MLLNRFHHVHVMVCLFVQGKHGQVTVCISNCGLTCERCLLQLVSAVDAALNWRLRIVVLEFARLLLVCQKMIICYSKTLHSEQVKFKASHILFALTSLNIGYDYNVLVDHMRVSMVKSQGCVQLFPNVGDLFLDEFSNGISHSHVQPLVIRFII
jgi:hypothetical protein